MSRAPWLVALAAAGCGRLGFGEQSDATRTIDAVPGAWPNQPPSCALNVMAYFDTLPPLGFGMGGTVSVVADPTSPQGTSAAQWDFPTGFVGGTAPGQLSYEGAALANPGLRELYIGL